MPITADLGGKSYVLGRGKVFFDRFAANATIDAATVGEGERYLGNTPEFSTSSSSEDLDHFSSEGGIKVKDDSVQLSLDRTGAFTCDNIDKENLALYFLGLASTLTQASAAGVLQTFVVKKDRFYQLGQSAALPQGQRNVTVTAVGSGAGFTTPHTVLTDFQVDEGLGRVYIPATSTIPDDTLIQVTYSVAAVTMERIISKSDSIYGAIHFVADNPKGKNRDYLLPYVKLSPDGDYNLKGDDWQQMGFTMEILKKASNIESMYVTGRAVV